MYMCLYSCFSSILRFSSLRILAHDHTYTYTNANIHEHTHTASKLSNMAPAIGINATLPISI